MQVLQITIANDIKNFIKDGSQVKMFIPMEKVDAIFHAEDDLPVVLVNEKQYKGMLEIIDTPIADFIEMETVLHQSMALIKAEQKASKQDYESEGISQDLQPND